MTQSPLSLPPGTTIPNHLVIMPDGDRRWARARGLSAIDGHRAGMENMIKLSRVCRDWGIHTVSAWGLSTENWLERPKKETDFLLKGIASTLEHYLTEMQENKVRFVHMGRKDRLPKFFMDKILKIEQQTKLNDRHIFNVGLDYNGWDEIIRATQKIVKSGIAAEKVDRKLLDAYMDNANQPYPYIDLYIRTSGEQRTSGFMMWQADYAEFYWEASHFPDFTPEKLREAILDYSRRRRRFGGDDSVEHFGYKPELVAHLELSWWRLANIPAGTRFRDYAFKHLKAQFGLSKDLAKEAAYHMIEATIYGEKKEWKKTAVSLKRFYSLIKDEIKLAFEPSIVADLEVRLLQETNSSQSVEKLGQAEESARQLYAEVYRISLLQAAKVAHLRVLASVERNLAEAARSTGSGSSRFVEEHWQKAEDYLEKFYRALKERVA